MPSQTRNNVSYSDTHPDSHYKMVSMVKGPDRSVEIVKFYKLKDSTVGVVEKELYRVVNGTLNRVEVIVGTHVPRQVIEDHFEFPS